MGKTNGQTNPAELDLEHELPAPEEAAGGAAPADVAALQTELQQVREERDQLLERLARAQAEFENARRRAAREQQEFHDYALADAVRILLPIVDSFDRALASNAGAEEFRAGMELIDRQVHDALRKLGVVEIESVGQPFDPNVHEAIEVVESTEVPDHHVLHELQRGYKLKDRLLRPAMVRVARNPG